MCTLRGSSQKLAAAQVVCLSFEFNYLRLQPWKGDVEDRGAWRNGVHMDVCRKQNTCADREHLESLLTLVLGFLRTPTSQALEVTASIHRSEVICVLFKVNPGVLVIITVVRAYLRD